MQYKEKQICMLEIMYIVYCKEYTLTKTMLKGNRQCHGEMDAVSKYHRIEMLLMLTLL